jgi:hypothetical protein
MKIYKVEEHSDLVKDMDSSAILNINVAALLEHKKKQQMKKDIDSLKSDMSDMKQMLNKISSMLENNVR